MTRLGALLCVSMGILLLCCASAVAKEVHVYNSSFGKEGSGSGEFNGPMGIAVNDTTHDVYVVDSGNNRVEEFNSTGSNVLCEFNGFPGAPEGAFSDPFEIAIDNSSNPLDPSKEDVYVIDRGHGVIDKFSSSCAYQGQLTGKDTPGGVFEPGEVAPRAIEGVAVDPSGTVWVSISKGQIYSFTDEPENKYSSVRETSFGVVEGLAVDAEDDLYLHTGGGVFAKITSSGETLISPFGGDEKAYRVAVDPSTGEVYLDNLGEAVEAFDLDGAPIESCLKSSLGCFGSGLLPFSKGVAVDTSNGTVYATDQLLNNVSIFEGITLPSVIVDAVSEQQPRGVTLNGEVNPEDLPVASCVFEYGTGTSYEHSVPCSPSSLGSGLAFVRVNARLEGLQPETKYHYRLVAKNAAPVSNPSLDDEFFTGPLLEGEYASDVASNSATLHVPVDPNGAETHYYLQYGQTAEYEAYAPAVPPGKDIGSTVGTQNVSVHLQNLESGTTYHYRFVVMQDGEIFAEPDHSFLTQTSDSSPELLDGRSWELVSPANKKGALIELTEQGGQVQAASDGNSVTYLTQGPNVGEDPQGKVTYSQVLSERQANVWRSVDLTLPGRLPENGEPAEKLFTGSGLEYHLFSPNLMVAVVEPQEDGTPLLSPEATERTLYLRNNATDGFQPLVTPANVLPPGSRIEEPHFSGSAELSSAEFEMHFLAATPDLQHVIFKTPMALTPEAPHEETVHAFHSGNVQWNLYEWSEGALKLINILPNGKVAHGPISAAPPVRLAGEVGLGGVARGGAPRDVSDDGRWIAWTWGEPYDVSGLKTYRGLYVRDMVDKKTVKVGGEKAIYQTMSSEGSKVFYLEDGDLYEFDPETGSQQDLTTDHGSSESSSGVQEVVSNVSEDGTYVYFVARSILASGGISGQDNLYLLHDTGDGWTTTYIAGLSTTDKQSWYAVIHGAPYLAAMGSRVSPDGRYLAFMSERPLTGYDNTDAVSGQLDEEVYLYDAQRGKLVCASCDPTGARPVGVFDTAGSKLFVDRQEYWTAKETNEEDVHTDHWLAGSIPGWDNLNNNPATYQPRYLSNSGRLLFDSPDALVSWDTNGLEDAYEYEPAGTGSCVEGGLTFSERSEGCLDLISSGTSSSESAFYDASENGDDVFFATTGKLVGEDYDDGYDVYDAHMCSSAVPCKSVTVPSPPCSSGDSCKAAPSPQPTIFGPAPSATFKGVGNLGSEISSSPGIKTKALTVAQRLARALAACHKKKNRERRSVCERQARKHYPLKKHSK
jgi:DNA-binding beta-propeller fold protein YncE